MWVNKKKIFFTRFTYVYATFCFQLVKFLGEEPESIPEGCPEKARSKRIVTSDGKVEVAILIKIPLIYLSLLIDFNVLNNLLKLKFTTWLFLY